MPPLAPLLLLALFWTGCDKASAQKAQTPPDYLSADRSAKALTHALGGMDHNATDRFILGKSFFRIPWVEAPSATTARDGLGPLFNANTCVHCHPHNGASPLLDGEGHLTRGLALKLSRSKTADPKFEKIWGLTPDSTYGSQIAINGVFGVDYEAAPKVRFKEQKSRYPDGEIYTLQQPLFTLEKLNYGPLDKDTVIAPRLAPALIGMGLVEAIPEAALLSLVDPEDKNNDGISGRPNLVWSPEQNKTVIGRYRWKASSPSVRHQIASAFFDDMSLTNELFPHENCTAKQNACLEAPRGRHEFDVPSERLDAVTYYVTHLQIPEDGQSEGRVLFDRVGCAACHTPAFTLPDGRTIAPYGDFLLHDMGEGLADGRREFLAGESEWRTAPLWGAGLRKATSGDTRYLHDGRARNLEEAVLWHGGEGESAKNRFKAMSKPERQKLIEFLESL